MADGANNVPSEGYHGIRLGTPAIWSGCTGGNNGNPRWLAGIKYVLFTIYSDSIQRCIVLQA